jgi:5-formyltetrahydrofolate cyclo-ligase
MTGAENSETKTIAAAKAAMRRDLRQRRRALPDDVRVRAHDAVAKHLTDILTIPRQAVVAGYWPMADEFDLRPLLTSLVAEGRIVGLPTVVGRDRPLVFRRWTPDTTLSLDSFGVAVPPSDAPEVRPAVLLVPLLAFDREGFRLGYGGGYYDRTLAVLRSGQEEVVAVGVAYAAQEVGRVPRARFDQRLDWIVTEDGVHCCKPDAG